MCTCIMYNLGIMYLSILSFLEVPTVERKRRLQFDSDLYSAPKRRSTRVRNTLNRSFYIIHCMSFSSLLLSLFSPFLFL